jgi:hypothetical protein
MPLDPREIAEPRVKESEGSGYAAAGSESSDREGRHSEHAEPEFYCPRCRAAVAQPLVCGDCASLICRKCGTPLENIDDLGKG